jgi:hypothetical protein
MNITKNNKNVPKKTLSNLSSNHSLLIISSDIPVQSLYNLLIQNPTYINKVDSKNETFLSYAIKRNKKDIIDLLLTSPIIDINFQNSNKNSYLHLAVLNQNLDLINELINKGIDMNLQNEDGNTALHLAYKIDNKNIIETLINNNINTNIKNNNGELAINIKPEKIYTLNSNSSSNNVYESVNNSGFDSSNSYNFRNNNNNSFKNKQKNYENNEDFFSSVISNNKNIQSSNNYQIVNDDENNDDIQIYESKNSSPNNNNNNNINLSISNSRDLNKSIKIHLSDNIKNKLNLSKVNPNSKNQEFQSQYIYPNNYNNFNNNYQYTNTSNNRFYNNTNNNLSMRESKNINKKEEKNEKLINNRNDEIDLFDLTASLELTKKINRDKVEDIPNLNINKENDDTYNNHFKKVSTMDEDMVNINKISNLNIKVENINNQFQKKNSKSSNNSDYDDFDDNNFRDTLKPKIEIDDEFVFSSPHIQNLNELTQKNTAVNTASNINSSITKVFENNNNNKNSILTTQSIKNLMVSNNPSPLPAISTKNISSRESINYNISQSINNNFNNNNKILYKPASSPLIVFLQKLKMEKYANNLINNGFDDIQLIIDQSKGNNLGISDDNLKEAGILLPGDRAKFLIKIQELAGNFAFPIPKGVYYTCNDLDNIDSDIYIRKLNNWLKNLKVENYLMNFVSNGYHSLELLLVQMESKNPLNDNLLIELGIEKIGYRTRIINKLKEEAKSLIIQLKKNLLIIDKKGNNDICDCKIF